MDVVVKSRNDENQPLASCTRKGRRGSLDRRGPSWRKDSVEREESLDLRQNKVLINMRYY
jgi:hypothetical protein